MGDFRLQPVTRQKFDHTVFSFMVGMDMATINKAEGNKNSVYEMGPSGKENHLANVGDPVAIFRDYAANNGLVEIAKVIASVNGIGNRSSLGRDFDINMLENSLQFLGFADSPGFASPKKSKMLRNFTVSPRGLMSVKARKPITTGASVVIKIPRDPNELEKYENEPDDRLPIYLDEEDPRHEIDRLIHFIHAMIRKPEEFKEELKLNGSNDSDVSDYMNAARIMKFGMFSAISMLHILFKSRFIKMTGRSGVDNELKAEEKTIEIAKLFRMFEEPELQNDVDPETAEKWKNQITKKFLRFLFWKPDEEDHQFDNENVIFSNVKDLLNTSSKNQSESIVAMQHNCQREALSGAYSFFLNCQNRKVGKAVYGQSGRGLVDILF